MSNTSASKVSKQEVRLPERNPFSSSLAHLILVPKELLKPGLQRLRARAMPTASVRHEDEDSKTARFLAFLLFRGL